MRDNRVDVLGGPLLWGDSAVSEGGFVLPTGTVTLLLADVEGSSRHWEADPEGTSAELQVLNEVVDDQIGRNDGVRPVEQGEGDSFVAAFARARDAVACATAIQVELAGHRLRLRMGLHTGDVQRRDEGNYVGPTINRAARIRNLAHGGQTVLSQATRDLVVDAVPVGVTLRDLGVQRLRDLSRPERVFQLCHPDLEAEFPPLRSLDRLPNNLPAQRTSFVGRREALDAVRAELSGASLVTLTGSGGCGKTRLALQVAAEVLDVFPDGAWVADLSCVTDPEAVAGQLAGVLKIKEGPGMSAADAVAGYLAESEALVVLDNCEHVVDAAAAVIDLLLCHCPKVRILATSRQPLGLEGEVVWRVPSLSLPAVDGPSGIEAISGSEAVRLFAERARRARPDFVLGEDNAAAVADICRHLDGIPLAIELAAARVRVFSPAQIAEAMSERFRLLTGGTRTAMPRQQTLRASIDWSHDLLTTAEQAVFRRLAVFIGDFSFEAAEAVCAAGDVAAHQVLDLLTLLTEKSLVQVDHEVDVARYRLLETVRLYAARTLSAAGEEGPTRERHQRYYQAWLAHRSSQEGAGDPGASAAVAREYPNVRAAMGWAYERGEAEAVAAMVLGLQWYWQVRGPLDEGIHWVDAAMTQSDLPVIARAELICARVYAAFATFDMAAVDRGVSEGLPIARELSDDRLVARFLVAAGLNLLFFGDPEPLLNEGIALARRCGDDFALAEGLQGLGIALQSVDPPAARRWLEESIVVAEAAHNGYTTDTSVANLAVIAMQQGELAEAGELCQRVLARSGDWGYGLAVTSALAILAAVAALQGRLDEALETADRLDTACRSTGVTMMAPLGPTVAAMVALSRGDHPLEACRAAADQPILIPQLRALALELLVKAELQEGLPGEARAHAEELAELGRSSHYTLGAAAGEILLGRCAHAAGELAEAEQRVHRGLASAHRAGGNTYVVDGLEALAALAADYRRSEEAARLLGAADSIRAQTGYALLRASTEPTLAVLREQLADHFPRLHGEGAALTVADAVSYAQRGRGERKRSATGWAAITPAEHQVVDLVGQGLTNADIGQRLFVSARTVQTHLTHIFAKLGISTRAELAAAATRRQSADH